MENNLRGHTGKDEISPYSFLNVSFLTLIPSPKFLLFSDFLNKHISVSIYMCVHI